MLMRERNINCVESMSEVDVKLYPHQIEFLCNFYTC